MYFDFKKDNLDHNDDVQIMNALYLALSIYFLHWLHV